MEKFYLEIPSLERKEEIVNYINEFVNYNSDLNGMGPLDKILEGYSIEEAIDMCLKVSDYDFAKSINRCQSKTFLLIRENDNKIIGSINVRWNISLKKLEFGGHIGYGIRPTERNKGYNKINLYLGLVEANNLNLDRIKVSCYHDNIASDKTIKSLGGVLEKSEIDPYDGMLTNCYWINVKESIEKYKDVYDKYIFINNNKSR